jgi:hypothetical protein
VFYHEGTKDTKKTMKQSGLTPDAWGLPDWMLALTADVSVDAKLRRDFANQGVRYRRMKHQTKPAKPIMAISAPAPNHIA